MERINFRTAMKNLRKNFLLLISTTAALCLFLTPSLTSILITAIILLALSVVMLFGRAKPERLRKRYEIICTVLLTLLIAVLGYDTFHRAWLPSDKVGRLAEALQVSKAILIRNVSLIGGVLGLYAIYILSQWIVIGVIRLLKEKLPEQRKEVIVANLKKNWYFPASALAFFCLNASLTMSCFVSILIAVSLALIIASQISSLWGIVKDSHIGLHIISAITAIGICPNTYGTVFALFFVYFWVLIFWKKMTNIIVETGVFRDIRVWEIVCYTTLFLLSLALIISSFTQTDAFYGTEYVHDIIYTSDSPILVKRNVYLNLYHSENDLRQPLFAVFAAPFVGIPNLIGRLVGVNFVVRVLIINCAQLILLFVANYILAKMIKLTPMKRLCFMLLTCCTYTHLLFALMMEQYIVAYFWLMFCLYLVCEKKHPDRIAVWGAGGTLMTSLVLQSFMCPKSPFKNFKEWLADMVKYGLEFIVLMLMFGRFDVIFNLASKISVFSQFTGQNQKVVDKIFQYTNFIRNYFLTPDAGVSFIVDEHVSWQLHPVTRISVVGVVVLLLVIVSAILNKDKKSSLLASGWVGFSVIMLLVLGWGTKENGLILYSLYFGWAFLVLLFQLLEKLESKLNTKFLIPVFSLGCAIALVMVDVPGVMEMVDFAITYFPI